MKPGKKPIPISVRFWKRVKKTSGCWLWLGTGVPAGYGHMKDANRRNVYVHRVSWEIHFGPIPDGLFVLHDCDNPSCVRPDHLFLGTNADNMKDCSRKGRTKGCCVQSWHGEKSPVSRLTWGAIREIRSSSDSLSVLAARYGVTKGSVWKVVKGYTWNEEFE